MPGGKLFLTQPEPKLADLYPEILEKEGPFPGTLLWELDFPSGTVQLNRLPSVAVARQLELVRDFVHGAARNPERLEEALKLIHNTKSIIGFEAPMTFNDDNFVMLIFGLANYYQGFVYTEGAFYLATGECLLRGEHR